MTLVPSWPNIIAVIFLTVVTLWYAHKNWDCFTQKYRIMLLAASAVEMLVLLVVPPALVFVGAVMSALKSEEERGDEECIWDFPSLPALKPGSVLWHYYYSMMALLFCAGAHIIFEYFA